MKKNTIFYLALTFALALCCALLPFASQARVAPAYPAPDAPPPRVYLPSTNEVARYMRYNSGEQAWHEVSTTNGNAILHCLRDIGSFKTWGSTVPAHIRATPIATSLGFRAIDINGNTNTVWFSWKGQLVDSGRNLLSVPAEEREILSQIFDSWREADKKRITSQPLPCQFRIGSIEGSYTLSGIARLFYGDATKWPKIYEANKAIIKNPDIVHGGELITIPKLEEK